MLNHVNKKCPSTEPQQYTTKCEPLAYLLECNWYISVRTIICTWCGNMHRKYRCYILLIFNVMKEVKISTYFGFCIFLFKLSLSINCIYILTEFACSGAFKSISWLVNYLSLSWTYRSLFLLYFLLYHPPFYLAPAGELNSLTPMTHKRFSKLSNHWLR